jgi:hypothetical protein
MTRIGSGREAGVAGARGGAVTGETLEWPTGGWRLTMRGLGGGGRDV